MSEQEQEKAIMKKMHIEMLKMVNEQQDLLGRNRTLRLINKILEGKIKDLKEIIARFEIDNKRLQESLDGAQREIERLGAEWDLIIKRDLG